MRQLLAIETSEEACSAALLSDGGCSELFEIEPRRHSELILPMIDRLLEDAGLPRSAIDAVAFGRGPGSFTGVRIATAVAQGIGFGLDIPVVPVSTLQALAQGIYRQTGAEQVLAALDARMHEVYWGAFSSDGRIMRAAGEELVIAPSEVPVPGNGQWTGAGSGWTSYHDTMSQRLAGLVVGIASETACHARDIAVIAADLLESGGDYPVFDALPVYLRNQVTHKR